MPRPRDPQTLHTTHPCCAEWERAHARTQTHTNITRALKEPINNRQIGNNSPCSRQSSLSQVCSDPLSNMTINIHQCRYGGLTYLQTADINQINPTHTDKHEGFYAILTCMNSSALRLWFTSLSYNLSPLSRITESR